MSQAEVDEVILIMADSARAYKCYGINVKKRIITIIWDGGYPATSVFDGVKSLAESIKRRSEAKPLKQ